ncbi:outer membrane protein assembly factor BamB family protein [Micromonospora sp. CPCC 206061]|uniref:outer membrane protein assembly factor BamB family protein n=1 Tax=Micromonospora sp. CPCC 206061 TaxID=3122410 RepID=UPI002FEEC456
MVIDLGEVREAPVGDDRPPPWTPRQRRAVRAVATVVVALLAAGAAPVRPALVMLEFPAAVGDRTVISGNTDAIYLLSPSTDSLGQGEREIVKYRVPGGQEQWRRSVSTAGPLRTAVAEGGILFALAEAYEPETIALDGGSGEVLWRRAGWLGDVSAEQVFLSHDPRDEETAMYVALDPWTGVERWSLTVPLEEMVLHDRERLARWRGDGTVEVRDLRTGELVVRGKVPPPELDPLVDSNPGVQLVEGLLLVAGALDPPVTTAYHVDRLQPAWQANIDLMNEYVTSECVDSETLCVGGQALGVRVIERATGRTRWASDRWSWLWRAGPALVAFGPPFEPARITVVDPADGREIAELGRWDTPPMSINADGRMYAARTEPSTGRSWIAELDPAAGVTRVLGVVRDSFACQAGQLVVTCRRAGGTVAVWYPRRRLDG